MPCNSDYMEPNHLEAETQNMAQLFLYLSEAGVITPAPAWVRKAADHIYGNTEKADVLARTLCSACKDIEADPKKHHLLYDGRSSTARRLADWWGVHKAADAEKKADADAEKERKQLRASAMAKLTPEEIEALRP